ncbi:MAG: hypothetical protein NC489_09110 [Ruminococcus flavefaciens]|nr:hypothetical protein [Ruminococcus flavefaciens]
MKDQNGFHLLIRRNVPPATTITDLTKKIKGHDVTKAKTKVKVNREKQTVSSKVKNPFKKGWKRQLWKNLREHMSGRYIRFFHNINFRNFIVYRKSEDGDWKVDVRNTHLSKKEVGMLKDADQANILIGVGDRMYANISAKAYKKLQKVSKIAIQFKLDAWYDGDPIDEPMTVMEDYSTIDNINDLLSYINYHRQCVYGIYEIQAKCCGYTDFAHQFKILVTFQNGDCKTYKGDMNEFLKDFDLYQF